MNIEITARLSEVLSLAAALERGEGVRLQFNDMKELYSYRVQLYSTRKCVRSKNQGVSGWERLTIKVESREPPTLWIGELTPRVLGIVSIEVGVRQKR